MTICRFGEGLTQEVSGERLQFLQNFVMCCEAWRTNIELTKTCRSDPCEPKSGLSWQMKLWVVKLQVSFAAGQTTYRFSQDWFTTLVASIYIAHYHNVTCNICATTAQSAVAANLWQTSGSDCPQKRKRFSKTHLILATKFCVELNQPYHHTGYEKSNFAVIIKFSNDRYWKLDN